MGDVPKKRKGGPFQSLGLNDTICKAVAAAGYRLPAPIQRKAIPTILRGSDVVAMARTGSGKTAAFLLPMIQKLDCHSEVVGVRSVILSPTRELAMQTASVCRSFIRSTDLRLTLVVGGQSMETQFEKLCSNPDIIIATPGRLLHHMKEAGLSLQRVEFLIFDEADRLFELGLSDQLEEILSLCPPTRQALLFSATLPTSLVEFARVGLKTPEVVKLDLETCLPDTLELKNMLVRTQAKTAALLTTLEKFFAVSQEENSENKQTRKCIIFAATKHHVDFLESILRKSGYSSAGIFGSMDQECRTLALKKFRDSTCNVLVVTDVAARGLDIPLLDLVIHYDFPASSKLFVHRSGRTARNGQKGLCISLLTADELPYAFDAFTFLGRKIEDLAGVPDLEYCEEALRKLIYEDASLESAQKSMNFSYIPYFKTRPGASPESVRRSRRFLMELGGPLKVMSIPHKFFECDDRNDTIDFVSQLRKFRPSTDRAVSLETLDKFERSVVQPKRLRQEIRTEVYQQSKTRKEKSIGLASRLPQVNVFELTNSRSNEFFLGVSSSQAGKEDKEEEGFSALQGMDLIPDDSESMQKTISVKKWDKKKKKYIMMTIDTRSRRPVKNEAGRKISTNKVNGSKMGGKDATKSAYQQWIKKNKKRLQRPGEKEDATSSQKLTKSQKTISFSDDEDRDNDDHQNDPKTKGKPVKKILNKGKNKSFNGEVPKEFMTNRQKRFQTKRERQGTVTSRGFEKSATKLKSFDKIVKERKVKTFERDLKNKTATGKGGGSNQNGKRRNK